MANLQDVAAIARLSDELGYPCDAAAIEARVRKVTAQKHHLLLVAQNDRGEVCGWLHAFGADYIESGFRVELAGLVVAKAAQRSGIGSRRVEEAERWARGIGAEFIVRGIEFSPQRPKSTRRKRNGCDKTDEI